MAYVILHYNKIDDTFRCVSSIKKTDSFSECIIVIVDNASPNNSGEKLKEEFEGEEKIHIILNDQNYGFSAGNNIGYRYVCEHFSPDFITICNNDIEIPDADFVEKIERIYQDDPFFVMGPDIYNPISGDHQNPLDHNAPSATQALMTMLKNSAAELFFPLYWIIFGKKYSEKMNFFVLDYEKSKKNVPLGGSCYVFSKNYLDKFHNAFEPETFLYYEEYLLFNKCMTNNCQMVYRPDIKVLHYEGGATNTTSTDLKKRHKMYIHNMKTASEIYLKSLFSK